MLLTSKNLTAPKTGAGGVEPFSNAKPLVVVLIDPRSLTREGLVRLLEGTEHLRLLSVAEPLELLQRGADFLAEIDIILLNLGSATMGDARVVKNMGLLTDAIPNVPVIVICDRDDSQHVGEALRHGIRGYIPTTLTSQILMGALHLVRAGGTFVPAGALTEALSQRSSGRDHADGEAPALDLCGLTPRQRQVLNLLRQGKPNKIIAHELDMRESTVKVHVRQIMRKLRVSNRTEAAFLASNFSEAKRD
jgi:DNA-binding NarL/FixJ family response regulator